SEALLLRIGDELVHLAPGSPGFTIPYGAKTQVVSGEAIILLGSAELRADTGDGFIAVAAAGGPSLLVTEGMVDVSFADGTRLGIPAGQFSSLGAPPPAPAAVVPAPVVAPAPPPALPVPVPAPVPEAAAPPPVPAPAEGWDPLSALARGMDRLASMKRPELKLVVEMHPYYNLNMTYDSNIYLVPPDKDDGSRAGGGVLGSWITTHNLGSKFLLPFNRRHAMDASYDARAVNYSQQPSANNAVHQGVQVGYAYTGLRGVTGGVTEKYLSTVDPAFSETVTREQRFQNNVGFTLDIARSRLFVYTVEAEDAYHKYLNPSLASSLNRHEVSAGLKAGLLVGPKTTTYLSYRRGLIHYSAGKQSHSKSHQFGLGIKGKLAPRVSGTAEAGLLYRLYDAAPVPGDRVVRNLVTSIALAYSATSRVQLKLRLNRDMNETTFSTNRYYTSAGARVEAGYAYRRLALNAHGQFQVDRYPETVTISALTANRRDDLYGGGLSLDYKMRPWMSTGLAYTRMQRHSIFFDQYNYKDDKTSFSLRLTF
ncbi:MAG: outer membrane beta-barrel protein, partial [Elusimicrobiota bacterium]